MTSRKPFQGKKYVNFVNDDHQDHSDDNYIAGMEVNSLSSEDIIWIQLIYGIMMRIYRAVYWFRSFSHDKEGVPEEIRETKSENT